MHSRIPHLFRFIRIFFHTRETTHTHFFLGPDSDDTQLETFFFTQETTHLSAGPDNDVLHDIV